VRADLACFLGLARGLGRFVASDFAIYRNKLPESEAQRDTCEDYDFDPAEVLSHPAFSCLALPSGHLVGSGG